MDFSYLHAALAIAGALGTWNAFLEKRIMDMKEQFKEKLQDKQDLNESVQASLREQILRLEDKIDRLIELNIQRKDKAEDCDVE